MPAYSFQRQFAEPILAGTKGGTIRAPHKAAPIGAGAVRRHRLATAGGHAYPGETLALYTGMRTKQCRLIAKRRCLATAPIELRFGHHLAAVHLPDRGLVLCDPVMLDAFAVFDGFERWADLETFWRQTHGDSLSVFTGWHIRWLPLPEKIYPQSWEGIARDALIANRIDREELREADFQAGRI